MRIKEGLNDVGEKLGSGIAVGMSEAAAGMSNAGNNVERGLEAFAKGLERSGKNIGDGMGAIGIGLEKLGRNLGIGLAVAALFYGKSNLLQSPQTCMALASAGDIAKTITFVDIIVIVTCRICFVCKLFLVHSSLLATND